MSITSTKNGFSIIGCGRVGVSLAVFMAQNGFTPLAYYSKTQKSAEFAREMAGDGEVCTDPVAAVRASDIVFITTPDTQIEPVCEALAASSAFTNQSVVFHLSGALSSSILVSAEKLGAATGSVHPLQAFAPYTPDQPNPFKGINMSIEGRPEAVALGKEIVYALGARSFTIPTDAKTLYHASAVVASNYLVTLEQFALALLMETGLDEAAAYRILEPLIQGTLANIKARGSVAALTGPVARGDHEIVARHLADIDVKMPRFSMLYRLLGEHTLEIAEQGGLDEKACAALAKVFKPR